MPIFEFTEYRKDRRRDGKTEKTQLYFRGHHLSSCHREVAPKQHPDAACSTAGTRDDSTACFHAPAMIYGVRHGLNILRLPSSIWFVTEVKHQGNI